MYGIWTIVVAGGILTGISLVGLLALRRPFEPLSLLVGIVGAMVGGWGIIRVADTYGRADMVLAAIGLSVASLGGGYSLASLMLQLSTPRPRTPRLPELVTVTDERIAVLTLAPIEAERFETRATAQELVEYAQAGLPEPTLGVTPFLYAAQKARYRAVGGRSPSQKQATGVIEQLQAKLSSSDRIGLVDLVTCVRRDRLDVSIARAAELGYGDVIVAELSVAESYDIDRAKAGVDLMRPDLHGMRVVYTPPLWGADRLADNLAERVWSAREEPELTGAVLVCQGQPEVHERTHATFDVQENAFANRVRMMIAEKGIPESNVRLCYAEWREPGVTETVRHLAALGCRRVLVLPVCMPFETISTVLDLAVAVRQARVQTHVNTIVLGAWGDDPVVAEVLVDAIDQAAKELGRA